MHELVPDNPSDDELQRITSFFFFLKSHDVNYRKNAKFENIMCYFKKDYSVEEKNKIFNRFKIVDELTNPDRNIEGEVIDSIYRVLEKKSCQKNY